MQVTTAEEEAPSSVPSTSTSALPPQALAHEPPLPSCQQSPATAMPPPGHACSFRQRWQSETPTSPPAAAAYCLSLPALAPPATSSRPTSQQFGRGRRIRGGRCLVLQPRTPRALSRAASTLAGWLLVGGRGPGGARERERVSELPRPASAGAREEGADR
eukprot:scaffold66262_cov29-Tisochrysis_lutea.AAC.1